MWSDRGIGIEVSMPKMKARNNDEIIVVKFTYTRKKYNFDFTMTTNKKNP